MKNRLVQLFKDNSPQNKVSVGRFEVKNEDGASTANAPTPKGRRARTPSWQRELRRATPTTRRERCREARYQHEAA